MSAANDTGVNAGSVAAQLDAAVTAHADAPSHALSHAPSHELRLSLARTKDFTLSVDLKLPPRGITALFGPSGSGKTTLLRCVAGLERAAGARVVIAGQTWQDDAAGIFLPTWQRPLGYVFQEASLFEHLDVRANLSYGLKRLRGGTATGMFGRAARSAAPSPSASSNSDGADAGRALNAAVELLGIGHLLDRRPQRLSGGERQRVAIARALATQPRLLLLDEPLSALEAARRQDILPWLERLRDELHIPMLYVTHSADEMARLADTLVLLAQGRVLASGPVADVLARADLSVALGEDAGALLHGRVVERDARWHLARVAFAGDAQHATDGRHGVDERPGVHGQHAAGPTPADTSASPASASLWLRDDGLPVGTPVRLRVLARDVSLALAPSAADELSIQNLLPVTVDSIAAAAHPSQVMVSLRCGQARLLARITARAAHQLQLVPGRAVWAQVKSVALVR